MDNQKIVVILLLITIILSVVSVVVTMSVDSVGGSQSGESNRIASQDDSGATIKFAIVQPAGGSG